MMSFSWVFLVLTYATMLGVTNTQVPCSKLPHVDKMIYYETTFTGLVPKRCPSNTIFLTDRCGCGVPNNDSQSQPKPQRVFDRFPSVRTISRSRPVNIEAQISNTVNPAKSPKPRKPVYSFDSGVTDGTSSQSRSISSSSSSISNNNNITINNNNANNNDQKNKKQQYMIDILRVSWRLLKRTMDDASRASSDMRKPCPCTVNCCTSPTEPRRILQFVDIPMTQHPGCCGCIQCPVKIRPAKKPKTARRRLRTSRRRKSRIGGRTRNFSFA